MPPIVAPSRICVAALWPVAPVTLPPTGRRPSANNLGSMIALFVSFNVKPERRDQFLAAAEDDSTCSVRDEPGCMRFDVLQDANDDNRFYFYEVYRDDAAYQAHTQAAHYARWRAAAAEVLAEPASRTNGAVLFPRDYN